MGTTCRTLPLMCEDLAFCGEHNHAVAKVKGVNHVESRAVSPEGNLQGKGLCVPACKSKISEYDQEGWNTEGQREWKAER